MGVLLALQHRNGLACVSRQLWHKLVLIPSSNIRTVTPASVSRPSRRIVFKLYSQLPRHITSNKGGSSMLQKSTTRGWLF
jgi:hypothetical protein